MSIEATVRKNVMAGNANTIRSLLLTSNQIQLVKLIKDVGTYRASLLAHLTGVSIQNASSKLNILYVKGYLNRTATSAESGGIEYYYTAK